MLLLPATFAVNCRPMPPPPPLPLPPSRHHLHRHHRGQTHRRPLPKKEATAAAPPAYQQQHQRENVYKSRRLDLFNLSTVLREFSYYQVVSLKKLDLFCDLITRRCLALCFWEVVNGQQYPYHHGRRRQKWPPSATLKAKNPATARLIDWGRCHEQANMLFSGNEPVSSPQNAPMARQDSSPSLLHHRSVLRALDRLIAGEMHICLLGASSPIDQTRRSGIFGL